MTKAVMNWGRLRLELSGHAGYAAKGQDIVCAGISMLTGALAGVLEDAKTRGRTEFGWKEDGAEVAIWADPSLGSLQEIKSYFRMAVKGLSMLQEQYPKHVEIKEVL